MAKVFTPHNLFALSAVFVAQLGCSSSGGSSTQVSCEPEEAIACIASTGCRGYKVCTDDGKRYGACDCSLDNDITPTGTGGRTATPTSTKSQGGAPTTTGGTTSATGGLSLTSGTTAGGSNGTLAGAGGLTGIGGTTAHPIRRTKTCDINGNNCKCLNLASFGQPALRSYDLSSSTTSDFETWLSTKTNATVTFFTTKPDTITAEWLNNYDVILLQDLRAWTFGPKEIDAFQAWMVAGGGVMALSGYYSNDATEITNTNTLVSITGMSLLATETPGQSCADTVAITSGNLVCPNTKASNGSKCYCWGNSIPLTDWNVTHPVHTNLNAVGAYRGRAVDPGTAGIIVVSYGTTPVGASAQNGFGKTFLFSDETVTYVSQWTAAGQSAIDPYSPCWDETAATACLTGHIFQIKQFWYNAISYIAPKTECNFIVEEPEVVLQPVTQ